jgi:hypothetical protein
MVPMAMGKENIAQGFIEEQFDLLLHLPYRRLLGRIHQGNPVVADDESAVALSAVKETCLAEVEPRGKPVHLHMIPGVDTFKFILFCHDRFAPPP